MGDSALPVPRADESSRSSADQLDLLAQAASRGDLDATRRLLDRVSPRVSAVARSVLGPWHPDLDDAVQQSLIGFVQALPAFRGECSPLSYASRITVRASVATRKRARAQRLREDELAAREPSGQFFAAAGDITAAERRKELLRELLDEIPEEQAEALTMRVVLGWSLEEVAAASGAPVNTVRSRVRLAKEALRRRIEANPKLAEELELG